MRRYRVPLLLVAALGALAPAPAAPAGREQADDFLIVDCLLPAQIRQLGMNKTFLAPRQALRTTQHECAVRGGEFSSGDAGGPAGLRMWLPAAEQGDATAQTYVGEIFERGLAGQPDYAAAVVWYRRAADQGNARAAIALGTLLEQGLGAPRDAVAAAKLFRRAAGLPEEMPGLPGDQGRADALAAQLKAVTASDAAKDQQLAKQSEQMRQLRQRIDQRETDAKRDRDRLATLQSNLADQRQRADAARNPATDQLAQSLATREKDLARTQAMVDQLRAQVAASDKQQQAGTAAEIARLRGDVDGARTSVAAKQQEADRLRGELHDAQQGNAALDETTQKLNQTLSARERDLADSKAQADRLRDRLAALEATQQTQQSTSQSQADKLHHDLDAARQTMMAQQQETDRLRSAGKTAEQGGAAREKDLQAKVDQLQREITERQASLATRDAEIGRLKEQVATAETTRSVQPAVAAPAAQAPPPFSIEEFGHYHAIVIGINNYKKLPALKTPVSDATEVARVLKDEYGFDVVTLLDADRYSILSALNQFRQSLTDKDNLLIYYAGHGELDRVNQRGNWLPVDAELDSTANWISNVQITDILNAMAARQILIVADSCYSGTLTRSVTTAITSTQANTERVKWYKVMMSKPSRVALTSGGLEPVADSGAGTHSMFANLFLQALHGNANVLAAQEVYSKIQPAIATAGDNTHTKQVPEYAPIKMAGHEAGDFLFVRHGSATP